MGKFYVPVLKNGSKLAVQPKYSGLPEAWPVLLVDYLQGMSVTQLANKFNPMCRRKFTPSTLNSLIRDTNAHLRRKQMRIVEKQAVRVAEKRLKKIEQHKEAVDVVADTILDRKRRGAEKHFDRIERKLDKADEVLEKTMPSQKTVGFFLSSVRTLDEIGRKLYGIDDDSKALSPHQLNVALLVNMKPSDLEREPVDADRAVK